METLTYQPGTYVYGVAPAHAFRDARHPLVVPGIGGTGAPVRTIVLGDLAAVVSDVAELRIDVSRENLQDHQRVLEEVLSRADVLPFSFGAIAASDDEVRDVLLRGGYEELNEQLDYVRGCVELELKVFWNQERLFQEIVDENEDVRALRDQLALLPPDADSLGKITLGELTDAEIQLKSAWEADGLLDVLELHAVELLVSPNLNDTMLLNAAFLVERSREERFDAVVGALAEEHSGRLIFNYVGPLPPYSFINLAFAADA
jgi:hypothetical protein